jgi:hypothetical protein
MVSNIIDWLGKNTAIATSLTCLKGNKIQQILLPVYLQIYLIKKQKSLMP